MTTTCPTLSGCERSAATLLSAIGWSNSVSAHHSITKKTIKSSSNILKRPHQGIIKPSSKLSKTINQAARHEKIKIKPLTLRFWTLQPSKTVLKQSLNPKWKTLQSHLKPHRHVRSPDLVLVNLNLQASEPKKHQNSSNLLRFNIEIMVT